MNWADFPWSAVLAATGILTTVLLLALVAWLQKFFTPLKETQRLEDEMAESFRELKRAIEKGADRHEARYATVDQLNGMAERVDTKIGANTRRVEELRDWLAETTTEARSAFSLAQATQTNVAHLTQRLEDVITRGLDRLDKQVEEIARALRDSK